MLSDDLPFTQVLPAVSCLESKGGVHPRNFRHSSFLIQTGVTDGEEDEFDAAVLRTRVRTVVGHPKQIRGIGAIMRMRSSLHQPAHRLILASLQVTQLPEVLETDAG